MKSSAPPVPGSVNLDGKRRIGVGGCLLILGGLMALMILFPVVAYLTWAQAGARRVDAQLAELRAQGQPTTAAELDAYYAHPRAQDDVTELLLAAIQELETPAFQAAARDLPIVGGEEQEIPPPGESWEDLEAARQLLDDYSEPLRLLHEAADKGGAARFPVKFEEGLGALLEHVQHLRTAVRLLALEAHVRAHEGDAEGTARSIRALLSLARSLEKEPVLISQLVGYACYGVAYGLIDQLLPRVDFSDDDLAMLQRELRRGEIAEGVRRGLVGERVFGIDAVRYPERFTDSMEMGGMPLVTGPRHDDLLMYLATMSQFIEAAGKPWPQARQQADLAADELETTTNSSPVQRMRYRISNLMLPAITAALAAGARTDATRNVVDAAIAVERYRREQGQPPPNIQALVPKYLPTVPSDPFDGQPLRYLLQSDEIVIYSIGQNEVDDGGEGDLNGTPDLVIRLPRR